MSESDGIEPTSSPTTAGRVISLWTPRNIFWLGVFLGWPTSLVLCIINWFRMGLWKKALVFAGSGLVGLILFFGASYRLPNDSSRLPLLILNILFLASLQALMSIDFRSFGYPNSNFKKAGIGWGILIGILTLLVIFGSLVVIFVFMELVNMIVAPTPTAPVPGGEGLKQMQMAALSLRFW